MRCRKESIAAGRWFALPKGFVGMTAHNPDLQSPDRLALVLNIYSFVPVTTRPPTC
jgi:hypothetical protein